MTDFSLSAITGQGEVLAAADAVVDVFDGGPAAGGGELIEFRQLILRVLVEGGHTGVDGSSHGNLTGAGLPFYDGGRPARRSLGGSG